MEAIYKAFLDKSHPLNRSGSTTEAALQAETNVAMVMKMTAKHHNRSAAPCVFK